MSSLKNPFLIRAVRRLRLALLGSGMLAASAVFPLFGQDFTVYKGDQLPAGVEKMYAKGLKFMAANQTPEGSFPGNYGTEPAVPALTMLAMLAHGDDPNFGPFAASIKKSLDFILKNTGKSNGYIGSSMYNHGFCTLALAEAYGAVRDERIGPALKKGVELLLSSQKRNRFKAWRYTPESDDADTTVTGACFVALIAARNAGLAVPDKAIEDALKFYTDCQDPSSGAIGYMPRSGASVGPTTAIGAAAFAYARLKTDKTFTKAFKAMKDATTNNEPTNGGMGFYPFYYEYYASQAMFQGEAKAWDDWNAANIKTLLETQTEDGSWSGQLGPPLSTAFALLSLALNYRYLPIYER